MENLNRKDDKVCMTELLSFKSGRKPGMKDSCKPSSITYLESSIPCIYWLEEFLLGENFVANTWEQENMDVTPPSILNVVENKVNTTQ